LPICLAALFRNANADQEPFWNILRQGTNFSLQSFGQSAIIVATTSLLIGFFAVKPNETEP
jgi:hypothetical protein